MNSLELLLLGAIWGASFLFMRIATPEVGPILLATLRIMTGALILIPVLRSVTARDQFRRNMKPLFIVGLTNFAIPFALLSYATLHLNAGFASIFSSTETLWTALLASVAFQTRITPTQIAGLLLGPIGIAILVWNKLDCSVLGVPLSIAASLLATFFYGFAINYSKRHLNNVQPLVIVFGSLFFASLLLLPFALAAWPQHHISFAAWACILALGIVCTGFAFILYFRLVKNVGPNYAASCTFLIPLFGVTWGMLFLGENVSYLMILGCAIILGATALANKK